MRNRQFYVSGKKPIPWKSFCVGKYNVRVACPLVWQREMRLHSQWCTNQDNAKHHGQLLCYKLPYPIVLTPFLTKRIANLTNDRIFTIPVSQKFLFQESVLMECTLVACWRMQYLLCYYFCGIYSIILRSIASTVYDTGKAIHLLSRTRDE